MKFDGNVFKHFYQETRIAKKSAMIIVYIFFNNYILQTEKCHSISHCFEFYNIHIHTHDKRVCIISVCA